MHIKGTLDNVQKADIESEKVDIEPQEADIEPKRADIRNRLESSEMNFQNKTINSVIHLFDTFGTMAFFGRSDVEKVTGLKSSRASSLLKTLLDADIIKPVQGHGKGKYVFA